VVRKQTLLGLAAGLFLAASPVFFAAGPGLRLVVRNELGAPRPGETVVVPAGSLEGLRPEELRDLAVVDVQTGRPVLSQAVDLDGDGTADQLVFQADFAAGEARTFLLEPGKRAPYRKEDFRVYGRFVRERFDDFAWENDRVGHRMYGPGLETWDKEPLASSTVDVWCKRTRRLVVNDWYLLDDYHRDHGEGADFYSAGRSRGCGGTGVVKDGRLWVSRNFRESRVLAAGPIRLVFELSYLAWDAGGVKVSEKKRVTLDAGSNLNRFESFVTVENGTAVTWAAGLKKVPGASIRTDAARGIVRSWEALKEGNGNLGLALVVDPRFLARVTEADGNVLALVRAASGAPAAYWAGSGWDKSGDFPDVAAWDRYLDRFAERLRSPLKIDVLAL